MAEHCVRLTRGMDILESIRAFCKEKHIDAGVLLTGVGCVYRAAVRDASGVTVRVMEKDMEIVSLTGTVNSGRCHVHIALAEESLAVSGGHLMPGTLVNTTCELVIRELEGYAFSEEYDPATGYDEIVFKEV